MSQPTRYVLRDPFFISSRLTPALRVGDATIHLHADTIDHDDEHDPRVVWQYVIEGPTVFHAGRDLTTPYQGPASVAANLDTAMSTLLQHLGHLADSPTLAGDTSWPEGVWRWARRHYDELTAMADLVAGNDAGAPMPASAVWWAITHDPDQTPPGRWCAAQATAHADRIATLAPHPDTAAGLVVRDQQWHETALAHYTALTDRPEPEPTPPACQVADPDTILAWLHRSAPDWDRASASTADHLGLTGTGPTGWPIADTVEQAQRAGLFGVAGHSITAHRVIDEHTARTAYLLTITTPDGATLATTPIPADRLPHPDRGPYAVPDILRQLATRIDDALAAHPTPAGSAPPPGRGFARIDTTPATDGPAAAVPPTTGARPGHHR